MIIIKPAANKFLLLVIIPLIMVILSLGNPPAHAQTTSNAQSTAPESDTQTLENAFRNDPTLLQDIIASLQVTDDSVTEKSSTDVLSRFGERTTLDLGNDKITEYEDLSKLPYAPVSINFHDLSNLSGKTLQNILKTFSQLPTESGNEFNISFYNDKLDDSDFKQIINYAQNLKDSDGDKIFVLNVSQNKITNFSPIESIYCNSDSSKDKVRNFVAWGQKKHLTPLSIPEKVTNNRISIDYTRLFPLWVASRNTPEDQINGSQAYFRLNLQLPHDGLEDLTTQNAWGQSPMTKKMSGYPILYDGPVGSVPIASPVPTITINPTTHEATGLTNFNTYDYNLPATSDYRKWLDSSKISSQMSSISKAGNNTSESIPINPQITNIPSGTKSIQLRAAYARLGSTYAGFTQDYDISLNWPDSSSSNKGEGSTSTPASSTSTSSANTTATTQVPKQTVVYATKKIGLYGDATFTKKVRQHWYSKQRRIYRPMFKVTGYAKSTAGRARYLVKDVNHHSKTYGDTGYITTRVAYVQPVYYHQAAKKITVINPQGVNTYRQKSLTSKTHHYRQGQVLTVKKLVRHNLTTRYVLKNGQYLTANKKLVQNDRIKSVKSIRAKTIINRYRDVNLTKQQRHYRKHSTIAIKGWDYSAAGTKRYRVAGGYITANARFIHIIK